MLTSMASGKKKNSSASPNRKSGDLESLYVEMRKQFTAADLQKYTVNEKGIPARKVLAQMEKLHQDYLKKKS